jgi:hypothetical protein
MWNMRGEEGKLSDDESLRSSDNIEYVFQLFFLFIVYCLLLSLSDSLTLELGEKWDEQKQQRSKWN